MRVVVRIDVGDDLKRLLREHEERIDEAVYRGLHRTSLAGTREVKKYITKIGLVDSGRLRSSINGQVRDGKAVIGSDVEYAGIHEYGGKTRPHKIRAKNAQALRFPMNGQFIYRKSVNHPGSRIKEKAYLRTPIHQMERDGRLESIFAASVRKALGV